MADVYGTSPLQVVGKILISPVTGPDADSTSAGTTTTNTVFIGMDSNVNPVGAANRSTADIFAEIERARISLMDYLANNLR